MVEIFKTDIADEQTAASMLERLRNQIPEARISFDLEDCDKILRVESNYIAVKPIVHLLQAHGFYCEVLD